MDDSHELGTLKLADMGLAKQHVVATALRKNDTSQRCGTIRYEAPEALQPGGRSRLYDIWSMGCITLEFIIWMLYGNEALEEFHLQVGGEQKQACQYFESEDAASVRVHHVVTDWINHLHHADPECSGPSALGDLLALVRDRLLVVALSPMSSRRDSGAGSSPFRATAEELTRRLHDILERCSTETYLCTGRDRQNVSLPVQEDRSTYRQPTNGYPATVDPAVSSLLRRSNGHTSRIQRAEYDVSQTVLCYPAITVESCNPICHTVLRMCARFSVKTILSMFVAVSHNTAESPCEVFQDHMTSHFLLDHRLQVASYLRQADPY
jgi:serine/threonine protein kinase